MDDIPIELGKAVGEGVDNLWRICKLTWTKGRPNGQKIGAGRY